MQADKAFLSEVIARPQEDEPRLVYADWLQTQNEFRAAFIRQQCKLARMSQDDPARVALEVETSQTAAQFERHWSSDLRRHVQAVEFERGFIERITVEANTFLTRHDELFRRAPLQSVQFVNAGGHLSEIARCPELKRLREIAFLGDEELLDLDQLLSVGVLRNLTGISLRQGTMSQETLDAFSAFPRERTLQRLDVRQTLLPAPAIGELLAYPVFGQLEELLLGPVPLYERKYSLAMELSPILNRLQKLEMSMCQLEAADLRELFHYCTSATLTELNLARNPLGWQGVRSLLEAPFTASLRALDLSSCQINARGMSCLAALPLGRLRRLRLSHNLVDHRFAKEIADAKSLDRVFDLQLQGTKSRMRQASFPLGDAGFAALLSNGLRAIRSLDVSRNQLGVRSIRSLLACAELDQLVSVDLSHNYLDDEALEALVDHGPWRDLSVLRLNNNPFSQRWRDRFRRAFGSRISA